MRSEQKFFICRHCGNITGMVYNAGVAVVCCGEEMEELVPNTVEASREKHLPFIKADKNRIEVNVGSADHPMVPEHFIEWIYIETARGGQRKSLEPGEAPNAVFVFGDDEPIAAYAYCNLHGLWKTRIE